MKIIRNNIIPFGKFGAINLFGILFAKQNMPLTKEVINHEMIHTRQMRELLYIPFYILYIIEWCLLIIKNRGSLYKSYHEISFEREAYDHGDDLGYLAHRKSFAQWRNHSTVQ